MGFLRWQKCNNVLFVGLGNGYNRGSLTIRELFCTFLYVEYFLYVCYSLIQKVKNKIQNIISLKCLKHPTALYAKQLKQFL